MSRKFLRRAANALSAFTLILGQFLLPANLGLTQFASAAGTDQPVWCQFANTWTAQIGDTGGGNNPNRYPLTEIPAGAGGGIYIENGQVYAPNSADDVLKGQLTAYCIAQYVETPPVATAVCGANNDIVTAGENMTITADSDWVNNSRTVTFTATSPYTFLVNGNYTTTATVTYTDAATPCPRTEVPNPVVTPAVVCGPNNDTVVIPNGNYTFTDTDWVSGSRTIIFTAAEGYTFAGGLTYTVTLTDQNTPCAADVPTVSPLEVCGPNNDNYLASTSESYALTDTGSWVNNSRTFTFTANAGYVFADETTTYTVTITDQNTPCVIEVNPTVTPTVVCGPNNDTFTTSTNAAYTLSNSGAWVDGSLTVIFTANAGWVFANETTTYTVTITDTNTPCPVAVPAAPSVNDPCGLNNATWVLPADTLTLHWYITEDGHLHVATQPGYVFTDSTTHHDFGLAMDSGVLCDASTPMVTVTEVCGATNNDVVNVSGGSHFTYDVDREGTKIIVTVTADADYEFSDGKTSYMIEFTDAMTKCTTNLPATWPSVDPCDELNEVNEPEWAVTPADTEFYTWEMNEDGSLTVTAEPGYILNIEGLGLKLSHTYHLPLNNDQNVCYHTTNMPDMPTPVYTCGPVSTAMWVKPADATAYTWVIEEDGDLVIYAKEGFVLDDGGMLVTEKNFGTAAKNVTYQECEIDTPTYTSSVVCGPENDAVTAEDGEHYTATVSAWSAGKKTVTFTAHEDYIFENGKTAFTETYTDESTPCIAQYSTGYDYIDKCGLVNDSLLLPENTSQVSYGYKVVSGHFVVTVTAKDGFILNSDGAKTLDYSIKMGDPESPVCPVGVGTAGTPTPVVTVAAVAPQTPVAELPHSGPSDANPAMTLLGLVASLVTYGAVLALQRRNA